MQHIKGFNTLRALSITFVILSHLDVSDWLLYHNSFTKSFWQMVNGTFGVQLFFVISGFLITHLLLNEYSKTATIQIKHFFVRRILRLFPPLFVFFGLIGIANLFGYLTNAKESILYAIFYAYNYVPKVKYSFELGHLWSLGVEEQFYLVWPFFIYFVTKFKTRVLFVSSTLIISILLLMIHQQKELFTDYYFTRWFIPASIPILIGCLGAFINFSYAKQVKHFFSCPLVAWTTILILYSFPIYASEKYYLFNSTILSLAVIGVLLLFFHSQDKKWIKIIDFKPLAYIGKISYGIYVYQGFFLRTGGGSELWFQQYPTNLIFTLILAVISYEFIEKPILKYKNRFR
jgi:peptidoglycan/LPS O-acetylase OafA/YrhL